MKQPWYVWLFWVVALLPSMVVALLLLAFAAGGRGHVNAANVIVLAVSTASVFFATKAMFARGHLFSGFSLAFLLLPLIYALEQLHEGVLALFTR